MAGFGDILGQDRIIAHFKNAIKMNKVSHAYMLHGEAGMGKKMLARAFAMTIQCEKGGDEPCMECRSCKQCKSGNHPDIKWIVHEKPTVISVDDVRTQINQDIWIKPYSSPRKIYIIDEAEKMNAAAQNAILKTIEEPPPYAVILLLTANKDSFLQTILSRCVVLDLKLLEKSVIAKHLIMNERIVDYRAKQAAEFCGGNMGKAIFMCASDEFFSFQDEVVRMAKGSTYMSITDITEYCRNFVKNEKNKIDMLLDLLELWYRDILVYKICGNYREILFQKEEKSIREAADRMHYEQIEKVFRSIEKVKVQIKSNVNQELALEMLFLKIKENAGNSR